MSAPTVGDRRSLTSKVLGLAALEEGLRPVLTVLRLGLKRQGLVLGAERDRGILHKLDAGYSRREWRYAVEDPAVCAAGRDVVLVIEFNIEGINEGSAQLLVEERPYNVSTFCWNKQCRSLRLLDTPGVPGWRSVPDPVGAVSKVFDKAGLFAPLECVRSDVNSFVQGFQP